MGIYVYGALIDSGVGSVCDFCTVEGVVVAQAVGAVVAVDGVCVVVTICGWWYVAVDDEMEGSLRNACLVCVVR